MLERRAPGIASPQSAESSVATVSSASPTSSEPQPRSRKKSVALLLESSTDSDSGALRAARREPAAKRLEQRAAARVAGLLEVAAAA